MRRLPKFVRIGGLKVGVGKVENLHNEDEHGHIGRAYGVFDAAQPIIFLDMSSGPERTKVTLVHEVLHGAINTARLGMVPSEEEEFVGRLAPLVLDFIRSNRGVIAYLQES